MNKICVFAGTKEGRDLVEFLRSQPVQVSAYTATEYGGDLLCGGKDLKVSSQRLSKEEMRQILDENRYTLVIDATHPYAELVTQSIRKACMETGIEYLRLLRQSSALPEGSVCVPDAQHAADFLAGTGGNILLTTGTKDLERFQEIPDFSERVYARVLPVESSLAACTGAGLAPSHVFGMQGPFTEEMNKALLDTVSAEWLVTKDGGAAGGFSEKVAAAEKTGTGLVVIGRPVQPSGLSFQEVVLLLCRRFGCVWKPRVSLVGIGPGSLSAMTREVRNAIERADCLIGAKRMLEAVPYMGKRIVEAVSPKAIADQVHSISQSAEQFAVLFSGDTGFFSGAKKLLPLLEDCSVEVLPGLSSLSYLCGRLHTSYEDVHAVSLHGRQQDIAETVRHHKKIFVMTGGKTGMKDVCRTLTRKGLGHVTVSIGERISYPDERITRGSAEELLSGDYHSLSVALIENPQADCAVVTHGLPDDVFIRNAAKDRVVPMTKNEVRAICLSKLQLTKDALCWDIGAGTGSVTIEMALQACEGLVYAVECREDALKLIERNKEAFHVDNVIGIQGRAPEICAELPVPTHVFIGGCSGNLREMIRLLAEKNSRIRIVATAVTMESAAELTSCLKEFKFEEREVVSLQVSRGRETGEHYLMTAQNPVYIFTMQMGSLDR